MEMHIHLLHVKHRLRTLKELCKKLNVDHLKERDIKFFYFHLKRLLTTLHILLHCEVLNIKNNGYKKIYIKFLLFKTISIIFKSEFVAEAKWELVVKHGLVDIDTRVLIEKISNNIAFLQIRNLKQW